jgi:uncharacterized protein (DUF4415 family)
MKQSKKAKKVRKPVRKKKTTSVNAAAEESKRPSMPVVDMDIYKPIKKPVTLRLDADVIAWFKQQGRGYQTRINRALRTLMRDEGK